MASEFITRVERDKDEPYTVIFRTDDADKYKHIEDECRKMIGHAKPTEQPTDYIKKADAYRIAVHGTDPDVAYKIQQLQPENVIAAPELHIEIKPYSGVDWEKLKGKPVPFLELLHQHLKEQAEMQGLLTGAEKCDKVEVEE